MQAKRSAGFKPLFAHPLPAAAVFLGREAELERMDRFLDSTNGVLSLIGVGGAGKTAAVQKFLTKVLEGHRVDHLLVWSFYDDPDTNAFLQTAVQYLTGDGGDRQGSGWFQALKQALDARPHTLLVLDGLERVQRTVTNSSGIYGELEDPLLKAFVTRLANSPGGAKAIITSRFPIADLEGRFAHGYDVIDVDELPTEAAISVLESHGVSGSAKSMESVLSHFGRHALTVDLLGAAIGRFFSGKAELCPLSGVKGDFGDERARHLAEVLQLFEKNLARDEHDIMSRLCVFRFGVTIDTLADVFLKSGEAVGGSLTDRSIDDIRRIADDLAGAHLLYREDGGKYSVHPAVRDHFYALFRESAQVHGAITKHLLSLSDRPGVGLPVTKAALDLLEELVYHALRSGKQEEALEIYTYRLGGNDHLNTQLGEYARTYRILQAFSEPPDAGGMYHCLRAFGDFDQALLWRPQNRYIQLARGKLVELSSDAADVTKAVARFLMGERVAPPDRTPDFPVTTASLLILLGRVDDALQKCRQEIGMSLYADDIARSRLAMVEGYLKQGQPAQAAKELESISEWVLRSGSQEHLCVFYLQTGRHARATKNVAAVESSLVEALQLAREAKFDLFAVDILVEQALAWSTAGHTVAALGAAEEALALARGPEMRYAWGEAAALAALAGCQSQVEASKTLKELFELQRRLGHPDAASTQKRIAALD